MTAPRPVSLTRPEEVRAVSSPVAHQLVSVLERTRRGTVAELAELTGVEAGSLYYHVRKLLRVGVLREAARQSTGGRQEVIYEITGSEVVIDPDARAPAFLAAVARSVRSRLRRVERAFVAALGDPRAVRRRRGRNLSLHQHQVRLSAADRRELYRRIEELEAWLVERDDERQATFTSLTLAVLPVLSEAGEG